MLGIQRTDFCFRFHKLLVYLGCPPHSIRETKAQQVCKVVSEFALEYRTTRERVQQQFEKKANHRERNKTRGKMITEVCAVIQVLTFSPLITWEPVDNQYGGMSIRAANTETQDSPFPICAETSLACPNNYLILDIHCFLHNFHFYDDRYIAFTPRIRFAKNDESIGPKL